ncbi:hypothetical protein GCM10023223_36160 [Stackebrandtia albiflava]
MIFGASSTALADFTVQGDTVECVSISGAERGCITHVDNGDDFRVCDTNVDGHGVYGALQEYISGSWITRKSQEDGGDPGCDTFHFDVTIEDRDAYRLKICWNGVPRNYTNCDYDPFRE